MIAIGGDCIRAFTEQEKEHIHQQLLTQGKILLEKFGIKKTSIEDLTSAVGIAKSSFYQFYKYKEELFIEIMQVEGEKAVKRMMEGSFLSIEDPKEAIKAFYRITLNEIENNVIFQMVMQKNEQDLLLKRLPSDFKENKKDRSLDLYLPFLQKWQQEGKIIEGDLRIIAGAIRSILMLVFHKADIGEKDYPAIMELLFELISKAVTKRG